ncbi:hypothetical protein [Segetibacter koreensis]|uniref:hypothetical protein n=1 Tax=Segetibacter koreensis TaxID=398037 RepID=UPI000373A43F|nr:hypothetical protein [Segetibacter koreensis]
MHYQDETIDDILETLLFSNSEIRRFLMEKNIEEIKIILSEYESKDLHTLCEAAIKYEEYEICCAVRDIIQERNNRSVR